MTERKPLKFDSGKFSKDEFTPEDRAEMRERNVHYDAHFMTLDELIDAMGIRALVNMSRGAPSFIKVFLAMSAISGAFFAVAKQNGWL